MPETGASSAAGAALDGECVPFSVGLAWEAERPEHGASLKEGLKELGGLWGISFLNVRGLLLQSKVAELYPQGCRESRRAGEAAAGRGRGQPISFCSGTSEPPETTFARSPVISAALMEQLSRDSPSGWCPFSCSLGLESH